MPTDTKKVSKTLDEAVSDDIEETAQMAQRRMLLTANHYALLNFAKQEGMGKNPNFEEVADRFAEEKFEFKEEHYRQATAHMLVAEAVSHWTPHIGAAYRNLINEYLKASEEKRAELAHELKLYRQMAGAVGMKHTQLDDMIKNGFKPEAVVNVYNDVGKVLAKGERAKVLEKIPDALAVKHAREILDEYGFHADLLEDTKVEDARQILYLERLADKHPESEKGRRLRQSLEGTPYVMGIPDPVEHTMPDRKKTERKEEKYEMAHSGK